MNRNYIIFQENGLYGLKDEDGSVLISPQYIEFYPFSCGLSCVRDTQYRYAYINASNVAIVPFGKYVWIDSQFVCGYARVAERFPSSGDKKWGIIDTLGNVVVPSEYDKIWVIKEKYIFSVKAFVGDKEEELNLGELANRVIFDGLTYMITYSVEEFIRLMNCQRLYIKSSPNENHLIFTYGCNMGFVAATNIPQNPVVAIVSNSGGKIFPLLMEKADVGKTTLSIAEDALERVTTEISHNEGYFEDERNVIDGDDWNDPYGAEQDYYDGWSREDVESGLADAFEGDWDARWNID